MTIVVPPARPGKRVPEDFQPRPGDRLGVAARRIAAAEIHRMAANAAGAAEGVDAEYLHDLRVASRRLRFALRLLAPCLGPKRCAAARERLAAFMAPMEAVRDLDVFLETMPADLRRVRAPVAVRRRLLGAARAARPVEAVRLAAVLRSPEWERFLRRLRPRVPIVPRAVGCGAVRAKAASAAMIRKAARRVRRAVGTGFDRLPPEGLHEIRIAARRYRYACEFFAPIHGDPARDAAKAAVAVQDCLGAHQDDSVAADRLERLLAERLDLAKRRKAAPDPAELVAMGALIQLRRERQARRRAELPSLWRALRHRMRALDRAMG